MMRTPGDRMPRRGSLVAPKCPVFGCDHQAVTDSMLRDHLIDMHNLFDAEDLDDPEGLYS